MSDQPNTRQELYDRIRQSSKDAVILEEMIRLGFWPPENSMPEDPADEIRRRTELEKELNSLRTEFARLNDEERLRRELRKKRMQESRERQAANKEKRLREKAERAERWQERKTREILYLGAGVSGGLGRKTGDEAKLKQYDLPALADASAIAAALQISVGELRFLAYQRQASGVSHYKAFRIPKKTGGERLISAPMPRLKAAQTWLLHEILNRVPVHAAAHGFVGGRSILSNARAHHESRLVVNLDLEDFFPSVHYPRVKGMFVGLGYGEEAATIFALLATAADETEVELDGRRYHVDGGPRKLPQGSPASPAVTNIICRRLDARLEGMARALGFRYTRYADDLTFSAPAGTTIEAKTIALLLGRARGLIEAEGFRVHAKKTRVLHKGRRMEVTGLVVNDRTTDAAPGVPRKTLRRFRALLHRIDKEGPEGKRWGPSPQLFASLKGFTHFVRMVRPDQGEKLAREVERLAARYG